MLSTILVGRHLRIVLEDVELVGDVEQVRSASAGARG
jgi:hypothetical protein